MKSILPLLLLAAVPSIPTLAADPTPASNDAVVRKMLDPTQNASAFKDPQAFAAWADSMSNPAASAAMAQAGMDPTTYVRLLNGMMNPAAMQNYMQFSDPSIAMKWMGAGLDPRLLSSLGGMVANPQIYGNWMQAPVNPQMWAPAQQMLNPQMYGHWMQAPMNPGMYTNWAGAVADPRTYGSMGQMMNVPGMIPAIDPANLMKLLQAMPAAPAR